MRKPSPREVAFRVLFRRETESQFTEDLLAADPDANALAPIDRGLVQELTYGVVRRQATLDWLIQRRTSAGRNQKLALQILLRLGLYQLFWLDRIPDHAAVHETVDLGRRFGFGPQSGFLNALLRGCLRERGQIEQLLLELKSTHPALGHSHPEWLFDRWQKRWGREAAVQLMEWNNQSPATYARLNTLRTTEKELLENWTNEGVASEPVQRPWLPDHLIFKLNAHPSLTQLPSFQKGFFYVQDPGTLLAVLELEPKSGESILDLCAAPGGKTTYLAQLLANHGRIVAYDAQPGRLTLVEQNCARLGVTCVEPMQSMPGNDGAAPTYDRVLVDAPCSNTGVMRRRVDLRWRLRSEDFERLPAAQLDLLERAAKLVSVGGRLVYSTCSLEAEENAGVVGRFLEKCPGFTLDHQRELKPMEDGFDGAFVARFTAPRAPASS